MPLPLFMALKNSSFVLDDFNKNRLNQGIVSSYTDKNTFQRPKTSNSCTAPTYPDPPAELESGQNFGLCRLPRPPLDAERAASQLLFFSKQQLQIFWKSKTYTNRYRTCTSRDVIARIQIDLEKANRPKYLLLSGDNMGSRTYFGPITLCRMNLKLMDDKGYILNLNNMDWSCKLEIETIYQY